MDKEDQTEDKLKQIEVILSDYMLKKGIIPFENDKNLVWRYLEMAPAEMKTLTLEECCEAGILLNRYAAFVQQCFNLELSRVNWAEDKIKIAIAKVTQNYKGASYEERKAAAIKDDEYATSLLSVKRWAQAVADRLSFMSHRIEAIAKSYQYLSQTKRK